MVPPSLVPVLAALLAQVPADVWPAFRGDGTSRTAATGLPGVRSPGRVRWTVRLPGYGQSSPVVWKGRVYTTSVVGPDKDRNVVTAIDLASGDVAWTSSSPTTQKGPNNPSMSRAAPTPVVDEDGVHAFFESGDLLGLTHDGEVIWERSLSREHGPLVSHHGLGSSLARTERAVIVLVEHDGPSFLAAVDERTGEDLWRVERPSGQSWATPVVVRRDGRTFVVVSSNGAVTAYDGENGEEEWEVDGLSGNLIPSATPADDDCIVVGAGESGMSTDRRASAASNCCLRLTDDEPGYDVAWRGADVVLHHASPLVHRGRVHLLTNAGVLHCLDLRTGERQFRHRLPGPCWATPIAAGDHVWFVGRDGIVTVIESADEFVEVARFDLWSEAERARREEAAEGRPEDAFPPLPEHGRAEMEEMLAEAVGDVVYGAAAVEGTLLLRTGTDLYCVGGD